MNLKASFVIQIYGLETTIIGTNCNEDGIKTLSFLKPKSTYYYYDPPSNRSLGGNELKGNKKDFRIVVK